MKNIHVLPTPKPSRLLKIEGRLNFDSNSLFTEYYKIFHKYKNQNIYITNDEEIKKDEYYLGEDNNIYCLVTTVNFNGKKIILTDNKDLIEDGVQTIPDDFLEWFVKNPSCEEVEVQKWFDGVYFTEYKIFIPKEESKPFKDMLPMTEADLAEFKENPVPTKREWGEPFVNTMPMIRVEPKQETLKEAAERVFNIPDEAKGNVYFCSNIAHLRRGFIQGAKWQQERSL